MGRFNLRPTLLLDQLVHPWEMEIDVPGTSEDSGRNGNGMTISRDSSGGGFLTAMYSGTNTEPIDHEYGAWLSAYLSSPNRLINVPIITDWWGPFPRDVATGIPKVFHNGITHSDGTFFSDGTGYSEPTVHGIITQPAALNAGVITMQVFGAARPLRWSDWFSIYNPNKGWRAHRYWAVNSKSADANPIYNLSIDPPLREEITSTQVDNELRAEFARPRFVAKLKPGFSIPQKINAEKFWNAKPNLPFWEAF